MRTGKRQNRSSLNGAAVETRVIASDFEAGENSRGTNPLYGLEKANVAHFLDRTTNRH